jgi:hypothetical protein
MDHTMTLDEEFERISPLKRAVKTVFVNPWINHLVPRRALKEFLQNSKCRLLHRSFKDPGGWKSMCVAYERGQPLGLIDKLVCDMGMFPMGLRNRKRLVSRILAGLFDSYPDNEIVNVVEVAAGCGHNVQEAMKLARHKKVHAHCIDLDDEAFGYGRYMARGHGHSDRVNFIAGDVRNMSQLIQVKPNIATTIGILEYLTDEQILDILQVLHDEMPAGASIVANSIYNAHGTDRFLRTILNLHITYRTTEEVKRLMVRAGLADFSVAAEPLGVYTIITGHKPS